MRKVLLFSVLLVVGLIGSQFLGNAPAAFNTAVTIGTMFALSFIMIHVGTEFDMDKSRPGQYLWDYIVAGTAAAIPWVFCALYFVYAMAPGELWRHGDLWKEALLEGLFASPTSAGVLFSMLAAAGLAATWVFKKARILAIFDDLDTILLIIPLKIMMVGPRWQLGIVVLMIFLLLWLGWRYLNRLHWPLTWPFIMLYAGVITVISEIIYLGSKSIDPGVPVHLEVLLPAFVWGAILRSPHEHHELGAGDYLGEVETRQEKRVATIISACFMVLVGLSMPAIRAAAPAEGTSAEALVSPVDYEGIEPQVIAEKNRFPGWGWIAMHVLAVTVISNLGKMFPAFCYRREASFKERLALSIGMFPRGEVGAGVLVISLSYNLAGPALTVAVLSLAVNLLLTGVFIYVVKGLIADTPSGDAVREVAPVMP